MLEGCKATRNRGYFIFKFVPSSFCAIICTKSAQITEMLLAVVTKVPKKLGLYWWLQGPKATMPLDVITVPDRGETLEAAFGLGLGGLQVGWGRKRKAFLAVGKAVHWLQGQLDLGAEETAQRRRGENAWGEDTQPRPLGFQVKLRGPRADAQPPKCPHQRQRGRT